MQNPFVKIWQFVSSGNHARVLAVLSLIILIAGVGVGLRAAQEQQNQQSRAATSADLVITDMYLTDVNGNKKNSFAINQDIYVVVTYKNQGGEATTSPDSYVFSQIYSNKQNAVAIGTASDVGMSMRNGLFGAGYTKTYGSYPTHENVHFFNGTRSWKKSSSGRYYARAFINYNNVATESNFENNQFVVTYTVGTSPTITNTPTPTTRPLPTISGGTGGAFCLTNTGVDTMLVVDKSGSMNNATSTSDSTPRIQRAKEAAKGFVDLLASHNATPKHHIGVTSISSQWTTTSKYTWLEEPLTENYANVKTAINDIVVAGTTCIQCAVRTSNEEFKAHGRSGIKKVAILLTDGGATRAIDDVSPYSAAEAEAGAMSEILKGFHEQGIVYYTIGFGTNVRTAFLKKVAEETGGKYYFAPDANGLDEIFVQISAVIAKGEVNGYVFGDGNGNKTFDETSEQKLGGWSVKLSNAATGAQIATVKTDAEGNYKFNNLCDDAYRLGLTLQSGWVQTVPVSPTIYSFVIDNANAVTEKAFGVRIAPTNTPTRTPTPTPLPPTVTFTANPGNVDHNGSSTLTWSSTNATSCTASGGWTGSKATSGSQSTGPLTGNRTYDLTCTGAGGSTTRSITVFVGDAPTPTFTPTPTITPTPTVTPTPEPQATLLKFTVFLHGIGASGDSPNPTGSQSSNKNPLHPERPLQVELFNSSNQLVAQKSGTMIYEQATGNFKGTVSMGILSSGNYNVKIKTDKYLKRRIGGIQTITAEQTNTMPEVTLIAGDVNNDNVLNILDYNMIIGCYSDFLPAKSCDPQKKAATDLTDDDKVNQFDYNLFIRDLSVQSGD